MDRMIAFCGLVCTECGAFIATQENDDAKRREVAEAWSKAFGGEYRPGDINCDGCLTEDGRLWSYCHVCEIRKCGIEKGVENCAHCIDYSCERLSRFLENVPEARKTLEGIRQQLRK